MTSRSRTLAISRIEGRRRDTVDDAVAVEEPLEIRIAHTSLPGPGSRSVSITMRTPGNDLELALGFLFGEGIIDGAHSVRALDHCGVPAPDSGHRNTVRVELHDSVEVDFDRLQRHFYTTSSCGVCGKSSLQALSLAAADSLQADRTRFSMSILETLPQRLRADQQVFAATGGLHAATLFEPAGRLLAVREDVGRHNAVDKVVGQRLQSGQIPGTGLGMLVSGRASFELMQKTLRAGVPLLAAVGAPSSLAVDVAQRFGMTLIGFLRDGRCNIYAGGKRVI